MPSTPRAGCRAVVCCADMLCRVCVRLILPSTCVYYPAVGRSHRRCSWAAQKHARQVAVLTATAMPTQSAAAGGGGGSSSSSWPQQQRQCNKKGGAAHELAARILQLSIARLCSLYLLQHVCRLSLTDSFSLCSLLPPQLTCACPPPIHSSRQTHRFLLLLVSDCRSSRPRMLSSRPRSWRAVGWVRRPTCLRGCCRCHQQSA